MWQLIHDRVFFSDVDECGQGEHKCDNQTTTCRNEPGSYTCQCKNGYQPDQSLYKCQGNTVTLRPRTDYAREIWKQRSHSEKASDVFLGKTLCWSNLKTQTSMQVFWFVLEVDSGKRALSFAKSSILKHWYFPSTLRIKAGVSKFVGFGKPNI